MNSIMCLFIVLQVVIFFVVSDSTTRGNLRLMMCFSAISAYIAPQTGQPVWDFFMCYTIFIIMAFLLLDDTFWKNPHSPKFKRRANVWIRGGGMN